MTLDFYVETLTGKTTGYVSKPHSNLESTKCANDYNLIPEVITHLPNPGMSEPSPICLRSKQPNPDCYTQDLASLEENTTLSEYVKISKMQHRARETLYAYLR